MGLFSPRVQTRKAGLGGNRGAALSHPTPLSCQFSVLAEIGLLMALGISKEEPVCVCCGNAERGVFIVSQAIIRAVEGLKIVWPAGKKRKVIV